MPQPITSPNASAPKPKLPRVAIRQFLLGFTPEEQQLFYLLVVFVSLVCGAVCVLGFYPTVLVMTQTTITEVQAAITPLLTVSADVLPIPLSAQPYHSITGYVANLIVPNLWLALGWIGVDIVAWALLLAAAARMEGYRMYALYFVFISKLYMTEFAPVFVPQVDLRLTLTLALSALFLLPAYFVQYRSWQISTGLLAGIYFVLQLGLYGTAFALCNHAQMLSVITSQYPIWWLLTLLFTFYFAKEPTNFITLLATNAADPHKRWSLQLWTVVMVLYCCLTGVITLQAFGKVAYIVPLRPLYWVAFTAIVAPFTNQNLYNKLRDAFPFQVSFSFVTIGMVLVILGGLLYFAGNGELNFLAKYERQAILMFFVFGVGHLVYLIVNFWPLIYKRESIYYMLHYPTRFQITAVYFFVACAAIFIEGKTYWGTYRSTTCTYNNLQGDIEFVAGREEEALKWYAYAAVHSAMDVKANYNTAGLKLQFDPRAIHNATTIEEIKTHYENASKYMNPPYNFIEGVLNLGNVYLAAEMPEQAITIYQQAISQKPDAKLFANATIAYTRAGKPQEAIQTAQKAVEMYPSDGILNANRAVLAYRNGRPSEALQYLNAAIEAEPHNPRVQEVRAFFSLQNPKAPAADLNITIDTAALDASALYNLAAAAFKQGFYERADKIAERLTNIAQSPEYEVLRILTSGANGNSTGAQARVRLLAAQEPKWTPAGCNALAATCMVNDAPEAASAWFSLAAQADSQYSYAAVSAGVQAARALFLAGLEPKAQQVLDSIVALKGKIPDHALRIAQKEQAILGYALGRDVDLDALSYDETMRMAIAATRRGQLAVAEKRIPALLASQPHNPAPHLYMFKLLFSANKLDDAQYQAEEGLKRAPNDARLLYSLAAVLLAKKETNKARALLSSHEWKGDKGAFYNEFIALQCDKAEGKDVLQALLALHHKNPLFTPLTLLVADGFAAKGDFDGGYRLISEALDLNPRNAQLWQVCSLFAQKIHSKENEEYCAQKADEWAIRPPKLSAPTKQ